MSSGEIRYEIQNNTNNNDKNAVNDNTITIKKKKGRPRKYPIDIKPTDENVQQEKKKRGRKKKEKVEEEVKQKKKRGRKAALKFFSSTIRKKIPLTTVIYDNDKSILHLDIKEEDNDTQKSITYNILKNEYNKETTIFGTSLANLDKTTYNISQNEENETNNDDNDDNDDNDNDNDNNDDDDDDDDDNNNDDNDDDDDDNDNDNDDNNDNDSDNKDNQQNDEQNDEDDEGDILCEYLENSENIDIKDLYEKRIASRLNQDNQLIKNLENLHNDDKLLSKLLDNVKKVKTNMDNNYVDSEKWIDNTDTCCWWCCHKFDSIPIGLPVGYNDKIKKFQVKGIFCSFACILAYNDDTNNNKNTLINALYKKLTGGVRINSKDDYIRILKNDLKLKGLYMDKYITEYVDALSSIIDDSLTKAPPRCALKIFGGRLNIEEFRNASKERKIYKMIEYPMYISRDYVEEVDLQNLKNINKTVFHKQINNSDINKLDEKKLKEVKSRVNSSVVVTNNSIDRFITF
jgi:hypothetical protein